MTLRVLALVLAVALAVPAVVAIARMAVAGRDRDASPGAPAPGGALGRRADRAAGRARRARGGRVTTRTLPAAAAGAPARGRRRLRPAHEAAHHLAAAGHDGRGDVRRRGRRARRLAAVLDDGRRLPRRRRRQRDQPLHRPRHRRAHEPHDRAARSSRAGCPPARALAFGVALGALSALVLGVFANWLAAALALLGLALYVGVYTLWLKRTDGPQHRHRRLGGSGAAAGRLGGRDRRPRPVGLAAVRDRLLLDAAALLGAGADPRARLRRGRACRCCRWCGARPRPSGRSCSGAW